MNNKILLKSNKCIKNQNINNIVKDKSKYVKNIINTLLILLFIGCTQNISARYFNMSLIKSSKVNLNNLQTNPNKSIMDFILKCRFFSMSFIKTNKSTDKKVYDTKLGNNKIQIKFKKHLSKNLSINEIIKRTELEKNIPSGLLNAIGQVESGLNPYTVNYRGKGYFFDSKKSALTFVNNLIKEGETNFSVGCFQLHYKSHANKLSANEMLDPAKNIQYAAKLLSYLHERHGGWGNAVRKYNSGSSIYYNKIMKKLGRFI